MHMHTSPNEVTLPPMSLFGAQDRESIQWVPIYLPTGAGRCAIRGHLFCGHAFTRHSWTLLEPSCPQVGNHTNVATFAARGAGLPGIPPVTAPLADPNATPSDGATVPVDKALRHVAHALLVGPEEK